jgi:hypothetical protein
MTRAMIGFGSGFRNSLESLQNTRKFFPGKLRKFTKRTGVP